MNIDLIIMTLIVGLASFRIAWDVTRELGPFELYITLRSWVIKALGASHWVSEGIGCPYCVSFWAAIILGSIYHWLSPLPVVVLAAAGVSSLLTARFIRDQPES